ncbi:MAG: hypothetical protein ACK4NT_02520, partial [Candidatus Omnitrophota bacterium]
YKHQNRNLWYIIIKEERNKNLVLRYEKTMDSVTRQDKLLIQVDLLNDNDFRLIKEDYILLNPSHESASKIREKIQNIYEGVEYENITRNFSKLSTRGSIYENNEIEKWWENFLRALGIEPGRVIIIGKINVNLHYFYRRNYIEVCPA